MCRDDAKLCSPLFFSILLSIEIVKLKLSIGFFFKEKLNTLLNDPCQLFPILRCFIWREKKGKKINTFENKCDFLLTIYVQCYLFFQPYTALLQAGRTFGNNYNSNHLFGLLTFFFLTSNHMTLYSILVSCTKRPYSSPTKRTLFS